VSDANRSFQRIFVGDVQGCADELEELLARATAAFGDDFALWIVGDLVNRGPENRRPLERVRQLIEAGRAEYILGNHEISLLAVGLGLREIGPNDSFEDILGSPDAAEWIDWLRRRPLVASGRIDEQPFAMVHAASHPDWSLAELVAMGDRIAARLSGSRDEARDFLAADPARDSVRDALGRLTRCRSITREGGWSSEEPANPELAWHRAWRRHGHEHGLVYGHWAMQGLHVEAGLRGLDTGCVHHGRGRDGLLTAWLPDSRPRKGGGRPFDVPDDRFWQVAAKRRYYFPVGDPA
jgi:bis(5'-nucleosyl)-tetraphosphatase (symmetrical)